MSATDALALIDSKIESLREGPRVLIGNEAGIGILTIVRNGLTSGPEWSEVQESKMGARLAELRAELAGEIAAEVAMSIWYTAAIRRLEGELERARDLGARLEQELALHAQGLGRRAL